MPIWASVVIGLGSGTIAAFATIIYQRSADRRSRRLDAAADFLAAAESFRRSVRRKQAPTDEESLRIVHDAWDDLVPAVNLVRLLYGSASDEVSDVEAAAGAFYDIDQKYIEVPDVWTSDDMDLVDERMKLANEYLEWFTERVGGGPVRRSRLWWKLRTARRRVDQVEPGS